MIFNICETLSDDLFDNNLLTIGAGGLEYMNSRYFRPYPHIVMIIKYSTLFMCKIYPTSISYFFIYGICVCVCVFVCVHVRVFVFVTLSVVRVYLKICSVPLSV